MTKITQEMIDLVIANNKKCLNYNKGHVLLYKPFSCPSEEIDNYIFKINTLIQRGISTVKILDYVKVANLNSKYPKCIILEEKAPGNNIDYKSENISLKSVNIDFEEISAEYIQGLDDYINEISLRANSSQDIYDKLVSDYLTITKSGLSIDPKPLNFYFDKDKGFTFIDINDKGNDDVKTYLPRYILGAVLSYGFPYLSIDYKCTMYIDEERMNIIKDILNTIITKVSISLMPYGYTKEQVINAASNWINQLKYFSKIDDINDLGNILSIDFAHIKEEKEKNIEDGDWSIGW